MDVFTPASLAKIVDDLKDKVNTFLLSMFFPTISTPAAGSTSEEVYFDMVDGKPRLAPFGSPLVEAPLVQSRGYQTYSFRPAYIKDKRIFEDGKAVKRRPGQQIAAPIDPMSNRLFTVIQESDDQIAMLKRRMEWMAAQAMLNGEIIVEGEKYPRTVVNFGRHSDLKVTLLSTARWDQNAADPVGDLEDWAGVISSKSGATATDVVMATNAWNSFREDDKVEKLLDKSKNLSPKTRIDVGPSSGIIGPSFKGYVGDFAIWTYNAEYVDDSGVTQKFLPDDYILMGSPQIEGVQHHGVIKDEKAGFQARDFYQKSWAEDDPAVRYLMMQSAPLVAPFRVNASFSARVIGGS